MLDLLLLVTVGAMFAGGYVLMDRLDRFLDNFHLEDDLPEERTEVEISPPVQVENRRLLCYNDKCKKRVRHPAACRCGQEEGTWKQPGRTRTCFCAPSGMITKHREN